MISTVHTLAVQLARDLGVKTFDTAESLDNRVARPITNADKNALILAINGAYEEIFHQGPAAISESDTGSILRPATTVTLTATQYSSTVSAVTTYASWMLGCTIRIAGDSFDNEITSSTTLARPYMGSSGSGISATVYADCIPLSGISHIMPPVRIQGKPPLRMVNSREDFNDAIGLLTRSGDMSYGDYTGFHAGLDAAKTTGDPTVAFVDTRFSSTSTGLQRFLRFNTIPNAACSVRYRAKLTPPSFDTDDIGSDIETDPGTTLPLDNLSSVLYAIARKRISGDPLFGAQNALGEIDRQYNHALGQLASYQPSLAPLVGHYN